MDSSLRFQLRLIPFIHFYVLVSYGLYYIKMSFDSFSPAITYPNGAIW